MAYYPTIPKIEPTKTPFDNIALAFSGGGFRAAAFGLGVLSYLNELKDKDGVPLMQRVTYISSASGGTIANALYALNSAEGKDFKVFYKKLYEKMIGVNLLDTVFEILNDDALWNQNTGKRRNLINAFALAYDTLLYEKKCLDALAPATSVTHLQEVCFNATDFYRGLLFRQQVKMQPDKPEPYFLYGNFIVNLDHAAARHLRIGDTVAASSCFPAGFEPIIFPQDFNNNGTTPLNRSLTIQLQEIDRKELDLLYGKAKVDSIIPTIPQPITTQKLLDAFKGVPIQDSFIFGLMDGGITDNQGLESLMKANERRLNGSTNFKQFDLMLVNDVGSHYMDPYQLPKSEKKYTGIRAMTVKTLLTICWLLIIVGAIGLGYLFRTEVPSFRGKLCAVISTVLMVTGIAGCLLIYGVKRLIKTNLPEANPVDNGKAKALRVGEHFSSDIVKLFFAHFGSTPLAVIINMLTERVSSILTLNNDVFLKRIRQLLYQRFFNDGRDCHRMKSNHVYDLSFSNDVIRMEQDIPTLWPTRNMQIVAQEAFEMGTTLWFDQQAENKQSQAALVACGQFTTCYNLLDYISKLKKTPVGGTSWYAQLSKQYQENVDHLEQELTKHYAMFRNDPFDMFNRLGKDYDLTGFQPVSMGSFTFPDDFKGLR